jgi:hypothetical protein
MPIVTTQDEIDLTQPLTDEQRQQIAQDITNLEVFKFKTEYILIGDEPRPNYDGVLNFEKVLKPDEVASLKQYLTFMPREMLWNFYMKKIWIGIPKADVMTMFIPRQFTSIYGDSHEKKPLEDMVWAGLIDLFNQANIKYVNDNQMEPWDWEAKKTDAYYISTSKEAIDSLELEINQYRDVSLALDPKAKVVMEAFATLPKLGDVGMEINRQNSIKELLKQKDYATAQAIVDAFRYINDTELGTILAKPIPYDIVNPDGSILARAT